MIMRKIASEIIKLEKIIPGGQTLGNLADGRKVFVWGALPNEIARIEIYKNKKSYAEAIATEILEQSDLRIKSRDECYLSTSPWQILNFAEENRIKSQLIHDAFMQEKIDLSDFSNEIKTDSRDYFYRNKMEYSLYFMDLDEANQTQNIDFLQTFSDKEIQNRGKIFLAFHKRGSHRKIPILQSSIENPAIFVAAQKMINELNSAQIDARKFQHLLARCDQNGKVSAALFEKFMSHPQMENLADELLGREYSYSPNGFFQINLPIYEMALAEISRFTKDAKNVVDMYSGVGTIGFSVASDKNLTLVETDKNAFREMQNNIPKDAKNVRAIHAKSEDALDFITNDATIILDPPRAGLNEKVISKLLDIQPPKIIYLSCNPTTQARDIAKLLNITDKNLEKSAAKYKIINQQSFNFFPRTPHIENLIVLENN